MNWYVYSSGLDTDNPPKLTTEQVVALIIDKTIGKNAQVMRADDSTKSWIKITDTEFKKTFASLKQLESQQKSTEKAQRQEQKAAENAQRQSDKMEKTLSNLEAEHARQQTEPSATNIRRSTSGSNTNRFFKLFIDSFHLASSPYTIGKEKIGRAHV
jgi:flagellar biosynthesis GTPase FlhF